MENLFLFLHFLFVRIFFRNFTAEQNKYICPFSNKGVAKQPHPVHLCILSCTQILDLFVSAWQTRIEKRLFDLQSDVSDILELMIRQVPHQSVEESVISKELFSFLPLESVGQITAMNSKLKDEALKKEMVNVL